MGDDASVEKGALAARRLVDHLVADDQVARFDVLSEAPGRAAGQDVRNAKLLERIDVGAVGDGGGIEPMPGPVARNEGDGRAMPLGEQDRPAGRTERGRHFERLTGGLPGKRLPQPRPANDPNPRHVLHVLIPHSHPHKHNARHVRNRQDET